MGLNFEDIEENTEISAEAYFGDKNSYHSNSTAMVRR
jgi:hypothetical protein